MLSLWLLFQGMGGGWQDSEGSSSLAFSWQVRGSVPYSVSRDSCIFTQSFTVCELGVCEEAKIWSRSCTASLKLSDPSWCMQNIVMWNTKIKEGKDLNHKIIFLYSAAPNGFHLWTGLGSTVAHLETLIPVPLFLPNDFPAAPPSMCLSRRHQSGVVHGQSTSSTQWGFVSVLSSDFIMWYLIMCNLIIS